MVERVLLGVGERKLGVGVDILRMLSPTFNGEPSCWSLCVFWTASCAVPMNYFLISRIRLKWTTSFLPFWQFSIRKLCSEITCATCLILGMGSGTSYNYENFGSLVYTPRLDPHCVSSVICLWSCILFCKVKVPDRFRGTKSKTNLKL